MKMILRMFFALLIALVPMVSASAQDAEIFCGTLVAADCDILRAKPRPFLSSSLRLLMRPTGMRWIHLNSWLR